MKYCAHCGNELMDEAVICPLCGCSCKKNASATSYDNQNVALLKVLSFIFPILGLILFLVWNDENPNIAKKCGKWALIGFIIELIIGIAIFIFVFLYASGTIMGIKVL